MKWVRIAIVVLLQIACIDAAYLMFQSRRAWMAEARQMHRDQQRRSDFERRTSPEIGLAANWPGDWYVTTGDPGLPPLVLSLLVLFSVSATMQKTVGPGFTAYSAGFLVALLAFNLGMVLQQNHFLAGLYEGQQVIETAENPGYTTEHGAVFELHGQKQYVTARDPNVIPALMITCFLTAWVPFIGRKSL